MDKDPFKEYIRQSEPSKRDKGYAWHTAIGLQAVDGLKPSKYLSRSPEAEKRNFYMTVLAVAAGLLFCILLLHPNFLRIVSRKATFGRDSSTSTL